ncbi:MAG TPA: SRPBCC family protein, partial [Thermomicrobiales bacterium]
LNPVPIQQLYDRWVGKFARPWTQTLTGLKALLEEDPMDQAPTHVYEIYIRTTPERLWQAVTDPDMTQQYVFGSRIASDWQVGSSYTYTNEHGKAIEGEILAIDPPRRLVQTWRAVFADIPTTTVTWLIEPLGDSCKLTIQHSGIDPANTIASQGLASAWTQIASSLKSLLETGQPLHLEG